MARQSEEARKRAQQIRAEVLSKLEDRSGDGGLHPRHPGIPLLEGAWLRLDERPDLRDKPAGNDVLRLVARHQILFRMFGPAEHTHS